jgi:CTP synthase
VSIDDVIGLPDVKSIYEIPMLLDHAGLGKRVCDKLRLENREANLSEWEKVVSHYQHPKHEIIIAMVGKYTDYKDAYKSLNEALIHAGIQTETRVNIEYVDADLFVENNPAELLKSADAILVPGGFGKRGVEGMIIATKYARENKIPFLGICLGLQITVIEYARHVANMAQANSTEFDINTPFPVIALVNQWVDRSGAVEKRDEKSDLGGTMRLGAQECQVIDNSLVKKCYGKNIISERHRHRYEVNNQLLPQLEKAGLIVSSRSIETNLVETVELPNHPWFVACQFHPEFTSNPRDGHPLFTGFVEAALNKEQR